MSWATIRPALVAKVAEVPGVGKVHGHFPLSSDAPTHPDFQALFVHNGVFNVWIIERTGYLEEVSPEDERVCLLTHEVSISAFRALKEGAAAEAAFQSALDAVTATFRTGQRTLGGVANTYSVPSFQDITEVTFQRSSIACYKAVSSFLVEEILRP